MGIVKQHRTLILGDFHFGESYLGEGATSLENDGYDHSTVHLVPFIRGCDSFILNLETPLASPTEFVPPLKKTYTHWGDPLRTITELKKMGVDAVSLANNHTLDLGYGALEATFQALSDADIDWFGAGRDIDEAKAPYQLRLPETVGGGELHFHGAYQYSARADTSGWYADEVSPGCAPLRLSAVPAARGETIREDTFQIAFPHWGANYRWRGKSQYQLAHRFLSKDYDLILGHGGHTIQEVQRMQRRWVVYGIGNGNFMSAGRWHRFEQLNGILPFSFWSILEIALLDNGNRQVTLKLYPVYSNNRHTNYQPGPVTMKDFRRVVETLKYRSSRPWRFDNPANNTGTDNLGHFVALALGEWSPGSKPSRLVSQIGSDSDPGDWPLRGPSLDLEDQVLRLNKHMGASIMALGAEADGGSAHWFSWNTAVLEVGGKRLLARGYGAHESVLGSAIVSDKILTAELLEERGVTTPRTVIVRSEDEAVDAALKIDGPVVVKPRRGIKSIGVSTNLITDGEVRDAFRFARKSRTEVIVQQHIETLEELRVMASPKGAVAVIGRVLPHVIGDGASTVRQLIDDKNIQRTLNPSLWRRPIPLDEQTIRQLENSDLTLESVVDAGRKIIVRNVAGLSVGADAFQALEVADPQVKDAAVAAVKAIPGMEWGGVDIIVEKETGRPFVLEINDDAGFGQALFPTYGAPRNVGTAAWKLRFDATAPEPQDAPDVVHVNRRVAPLVPHAKNEKGSQKRFAELFQESLVQQGYKLERMNSRVRLAKLPNGATWWMTSSGRTAKDRSVVHRVMRRQENVHKLLELSAIPQVRGKRIESPSELNTFTRRGTRNYFVSPVSTSWSGPYVNYWARSAIDMTSLPDPVWVQARFQGERVRVLATRQKAMVVTARSTQRVLDESHIYSAGKLAVEAIRAVPELRWAAVDILIRPTRLRGGRRGGLLVEGLAVSPGYSSQDYVLAGDFDSFCRKITE